MNSESPSGILRWLPLAAAGAVVILLVGLFWVVSAPPKTPENTVSAEVTQSERVQPRPTATSIPAPTPSIVTPVGDTEAPAFRGIVRWVNSEPLTIEELRGRVVLIDFWTYS